MSSLASLHAALGRTRARLGALRPVRGLARRALLRSVLFAAFVMAVSLVGRAWALARVPSGPTTVAEPIPGVPALPAPAGRPFGTASSADSPAIAALSTTSPRTPDAPASATTEPLVNLNTATATELESLPYVGPKRAQAILALRAKLGRFKAVDDLLKVKGIGRGTLKRMRPRLTIT